jgi:hypothetical protein
MRRNDARAASPDPGGVEGDQDVQRAHAAAPPSDAVSTRRIAQAQAGLLRLLAKAIANSIAQHPPETVLQSGPEATPSGRKPRGRPSHPGTRT